MPAPTNTSPAWWNLVAQWRTRAADFERRYRELLAQRGYVSTRPALYARWKQLVADANATRARIVSMTKTLDSVVGAASDAWNWVKSTTGLQGLGVLPLIPIAVISASIAAITKWVTDARQFDREIAEAKRLEATGIAPAQAAAIARKSSDTGGIKLPFGFSISPLAIAGIAAVFIVPAFLKK